MKNSRKNFEKIAFLFCIIFALSGCYKLQKDYKYTPQPLDPHINKTAWQFLVDRSIGKNPDTVFKRMYDAIIYSGMDTNEYKKPNRTYIFLYTDAISRTSNLNPATSDVGFFGAFLVKGKNGTKWSDYPPDFVKTYLQYLIIEGVYDHYTLPAINTIQVKTLAPADIFATLPSGITFNPTIPYMPNPKSTMELQVVNSSPSNTSDYPIQLNEYRNVRTSSILATNGSIHVIDRFLNTGFPQ
jgi:hypothetical protein